MQKLQLGFGLSLMLAAGAACYTGPAVEGAAPAREVAAAEPEPDASAGAGLPCEIATLLEQKCTSCHGTPLSGGALNRLLDATDLAASSMTDPARSNADVSIERMRDTTKPMPPDQPLTAAEISAFETWVKAGMPAGSCTPVNAAGAPAVCTSGKTWTRGNRGSPDMHPGRACIDCHSRGEGPIYAFAGTVYPTAREPDDCYGSNGSSVSTQVEITDARGQVFRVDVGAAGNFESERRTRITAPYTAKVIVGTKVREMKTPQTNGDCNSCHTERGNEKAAGRIVAP
jgi:hypothetical protein